MNTLQPNGADFKASFEGKAWMVFTLFLLVSKSEKQKQLLNVPEKYDSNKANPK